MIGERNWQIQGATASQSRGSQAELATGPVPGTSCAAIRIKKSTRYTKRQNPQFVETEPASEPDLTGMLELLDWEFKTTMITMLRTLLD